MWATPNDIVARLREAGLPEAKMAICHQFFSEADVLKFSPSPIASVQDLIASAEELIGQMEDTP
jgi:hypothetical protein